MKNILRKIMMCTAIGSVTLASLSLTSCSNKEDVVESQRDGVKELTFGITNYKQYSLDDVVETTRATGTADVLAHLAFAVFDEQGEVVTQVITNRGDVGYGTFSLSLPYGYYTLVFLGYDGSRALNIESPTHISFADDYVPNCFCEAFNLNVDEETEAIQSITLDRCVGCFTLRCSNGIPATMKAMNYTATGGGTVLNALTGYAATTSTRSASVDFSSTKNPSNPQTMNIYTFLPAEKANMQFVMTAVDAGNTVLRERTFADVPMQLNKRILYEGDFFAADAINANFSITLADADWVEEKYNY